MSTARNARLRKQPMQSVDPSKRTNCDVNPRRSNVASKMRSGVPEIGSYAIALDGEKRQCQVRSSNAGHALFTGIASEEHARQIHRQLRSEKYFSGWGVRTVATTEVRYNPMSYHNGSVWPHDNALDRARSGSVGGQIACL